MSSPSRALRPIGRRWSPFPKALSQTPVFYTARPRIRGHASCGVPVYVPAFAGTHCTYPWREARLSWPGWLVTY